jgi:peroxiredoxin
MLHACTAGKKSLVLAAVGSAVIVPGLFMLSSILGGIVAGSRTGGLERGLGREVADFALRDAVTGRTVAFSDFRDRRAMVLIFLGIDCPISNLILPRLNALSALYAARGVAFIGINADDHEPAERVAEHARSHGVRFPILLDDGHAIADRFQVERMCEVLVVDGGGRLRYRGAMDDQYGRGARKDAPSRPYLSDALNAVLGGKTVAVPDTPVVGCLIERPRPKKLVRSIATVRPAKSCCDDQGEAADASSAMGRVTYAADIAPILQNKCQSCHRVGQAGPFALITYAQARRHAAMIREVVDEGRMPPWHADPRYGRFANDRSLTVRERLTLLAWIDQGVPEGDPKSLPPPRTFPEGWSIGTPDVVLSMPEVYTVQAEGTLPFQHFRVPTGFTEDRWVQAAEVRPGDRSVVHHILVRVTPHRDRGPEEPATEPYFGIYLVGDIPSVFPAGTARKVPAGSDLYFEVHYSPIGQARPDRSAIGLIFAKAPPVHQAKSKGVANDRIRIPPGAKNHRVDSSFTFEQDSHLLSMTPHMHLRGTDFRYTAVYPSGQTETLLFVPSYDFAWQSVYRLEEPKPMPRGTRIECVAHFDNSADNPANPDPTATVRWGEQTYNEMMCGYIDYYIDDLMIPSHELHERSAPVLE